MSVVFARFAYLLPIHVQVGRSNEAALTLGSLCRLGEHNGVLGGVAGSADTDWHIHSLQYLLNGLDCILG